MLKLSLAACVLPSAGPANAQALPAAQYREPPAAIRAILDAPPTPAVLLAPGGRTLLLLGHSNLPPIAELAGPELRLAGLRINPQTHGPGRGGSISTLTFQDTETGSMRAVTGPPEARIGFVTWSPDGRRVAFGNTVEDGVELWVADAATGAARRVLGPVMNATLGHPFAWLPDGSALLVKRVPGQRGAAPPPPVPAGPIVQQGDGRPLRVRTLPDLLASPRDELAFDQYFTSQLILQPVVGGDAQRLGDPAVVSSIAVSPDGRYVLLSRVTRPYSYSVGVSGFGSTVEVLDLAGNTVFTVSRRTHIELPATRAAGPPAGRRIAQWRADVGASLVWVESVDTSGGPARARDRLVLLDAPFHGEPRTLVELEGRFSGVQWASDDLALVHSRTPQGGTAANVIAPGRAHVAPRVLWQPPAVAGRGDPGTPVTVSGAAGQSLLLVSPDSDAFYTTGTAATPQGRTPFLDRIDLATGAAQRLWQAGDPWYESVAAVLDPSARRILTRRESERHPPNYVVRDLAAGTVTPLTRFADPAPQLAGMQRQLLTYRRADGVMLSATLYTPADYDPARDGPLPLFIWAYPREYRDADRAGRTAGSRNRFSRPSGLSPLLLVALGYAVLDGPAIPIIGADGAEPNDTYLEQLVSSVRAAIDAVVAMGVADRDRIGVGGHSYGASMTANLLAHTDLFRAGIAMSGAYNRTLTPFGFQMEHRSFWEARDVYDRMSAFNHADRILTPLLLIHGAEDSNPGTQPFQSERMYHALAGHGAPVRYVSLPHEDHSYTARESVLHVVAEMIDWLDAHVKHAEGPRR